MKKILALMILVFVLFSCKNSQEDEISKVKNELLNQEVTTTQNNNFNENESNFSSEVNNLDEDISKENLEISDNSNEVEYIDEKSTQDENTFEVIDQSEFEWVTPNPQIPELKVYEEQNFWEITCENLEEFLSTKSSWYYWNTCRKLNDDIITLNFLDYKKWDYNYFKYYIDTKRNIFGEVFLQSGTWVNSSELSDLNSKLKDEEFLITTTTNDLFINYKNTNETE